MRTYITKPQLLAENKKLKEQVIDLEKALFLAKKSKATFIKGAVSNTKKMGFKGGLDDNIKQFTTPNTLPEQSGQRKQRTR